jgi:hypothetical protein
MASDRKMTTNKESEITKKEKSEYSYQKIKENHEKYQLG